MAVSSLVVGLGFLSLQKPQDVGAEWFVNVNTAIYPLFAFLVIAFIASLARYPKDTEDAMKGRINELQSEIDELQNRLRPVLLVNEVDDMELTHPTIARDLKTGKEWGQIYLHGVVKAFNDVRVQNCTARITELYRRNAETEKYEKIDLGHQLRCRWALTHTDAIEIGARAEERFDIAAFDEATNSAMLQSVSLPNSARDLIAQIGTYRVRLLIHGAGLPYESEIEFRWGPNWNNVVAHVINHG